jgi:transcriptional regulator
MMAGVAVIELLRPPGVKSDIGEISHCLRDPPCSIDQARRAGLFSPNTPCPGYSVSYRTPVRWKQGAATNDTFVNPFNNSSPRRAFSQRRKEALADAWILISQVVVYLWTFQWKKNIFLGMSKGKNEESQKSEVLQGTLDLMVLKVLDALGPQHGYGIARRIEQVSQHVLQLNEGTVYTSLLRLQQRKWIASEWGASENNRKAKYYSITKSGRKQLARETENWERIAGVIGRLLKLEG